MTARCLESAVDRAFTFVAAMALRGARVLARLRAPRLVRWLRRLEGWIARVDAAHPLLGSVREIRELVETDPVAHAALRKMLLGARDSQAISVFRGVLRHHAFGRPFLPSAIGVPSRRPAAHRHGPALHVGLVGASDDLIELGEAYGDAGASSVTRFDGHTATDWLRFLEQVNAVEIADPAQGTWEALDAALSRGVGVSLHRAAAPGPKELDRLWRGHAPALCRFRLFDPMLHYPPFRALERIVSGGVLGEVTTIRVRSTIGGSGGSRPPSPPERTGYVTHPAFDRFVLLTLLGGPIASLTGYLNPMDPRRGGQGLLAFRHVHPGRYSHLEMVWAPEFVIASRHEPYGLEVEVAGTDGIAWLRRGVAKGAQQPPVEVRVGRSHFSVDAAAGLDEDWSAAFRDAALDFGDQLAGRRSNRIDTPVWLSALAARAAASRASDSPRVVEL